MLIKKFFRLKQACLLLCVLPALCFSTYLMATPHYEVEFKGLDDQVCLSAVKQASQLVALAERSPISLMALQRRIEVDLGLFAKVMRSQAYYDAKIDFFIDRSKELAKVIFTFEKGQQYIFAKCAVLLAASGSLLDCDLGIALGEIAFTSKILEAEEHLLMQLARQGYPYATVRKRDVIADQQNKHILLTFFVEPGSKTYFGEVTVRGHETIAESFIQAKIAWQEGQPYNLELVERTKEALEATGLFSLVSITLVDQQEDSVAQPIKITVIEAKPRTIESGIGYTTGLGMAGSLGWEHRNIGSAGQKLNTQLNLWKKKQETTVAYSLPDFMAIGQNLTWSASANRELTRSYHETSLKISGIFNRTLTEYLNISYGGLYQMTRTSHSDNNGIFHLLKAPLNLHYSHTNSLLDPTEGHTLNCSITPALQLSKHKFAYCPSLLTATYYYPVTDDHRLVLAAKGTFGTIIGASRRVIAPSELFYAGSENTLRGYRYKTVSPLNAEGDPVGGKSMGILSFEARYRLNQKFGLVGFYEVGNVFASPCIKLKHKQLQSVGAGVRYHTVVGPIRFDVAFPLNKRKVPHKRKSIDSDYQFYMSIGQSF